MKALLRKLFRPVLNVFERGEGDYHYKPLNRKILIFLGFMFSLLAAGIAYVVALSNELGALLPVIIFGCVGIVCLIVGALGTERAVAKIWGNK